MVVLTIVATCIAHDVNPRAYLHKAVHCIVHGWPNDKLRELLPDRMLVAHPELYVGDPDALPLRLRHANSRAEPVRGAPTTKRNRRQEPDGRRS